VDLEAMPTSIFLDDDDEDYWLIFRPINYVYQKYEIEDIEDVFEIEYATAAIILAATLNFTGRGWQIHWPSLLWVFFCHS